MRNRRRFTPGWLTYSLALFAAVIHAPAVNAQTDTLDLGRFNIRVAGQHVGEESFLIRRTGTGANAETIARGDITLTSDGAQITSTLQLAGSTLQPAAYELEVQGEDSQTIRARAIRGRFSANIISPTGENQREYLVSQGAIVVDEGVAHHHYFIARAVKSGTARIPIVVPRANRQIFAEVTVTGTETLVIAGTEIEARRISVRPSNGPERLVWADDQDRILRLEIPDQQYVAERTAPPG